MKNFCVIGAQVNRQWDRTWLDTEDAALGHAESLARKSYTQNQKPVQLFVVERKKVVEIGMPETTIRDPADKDDTISFAAGKAADLDEDD